MIRAGALVTLLAFAPLQCTKSRGAEDRMEDTAGDALWDLAQACKKENDSGCERRTLKFLVERYPSSRHAGEANDRLGLAPTKP